MVHIFVLTGAGISAESGLHTFRGSDPESLWASYDPYELATPEAFEREPQKVFEFTNILRRAAIAASPNLAHVALAELETSYRNRGHRFTLVTQNVDDLHERAGSTDVIHMHGEILKKRCTQCESISRCDYDLDSASFCPACGGKAIRPHLVWFGETPLFMDVISQSLGGADLFVAIGTSGTVYPAAGFVDEAKSLGIRTVEINLERTSDEMLFDDAHYGLATETVPIWCEQQLTNGDARSSAEKLFFA